MDGDQTPEGARGPAIDVFSVDGGRSWIYNSGISQGGTVDVCYVDGGRSRISVSTSQEARRRCFFTLMVGAFEFPSVPGRGPAVNIS
jgi:hypothetical protein